MSKARLETFSDGVFAIAITLLVLTIAQPSDYGRLGHELGDRWPALAAYAVSFAVVGIMWLNHHSIFSRFERADRGLFYLNLALLLTVCLIPYPTGILGEALRRGQGTRIAAVAYSVTMVVNAGIWAALWLYASGRRRLLGEAFPEEQRKAATLSFAGGSILYLIALGIAFVSAPACLAFHGALAVYYALDPVSRRAPVTEPPS